jgi:glycosyltransferase involved in cell wall biosynthesis
VVEDGINGYLCEVRNARSLAEAMGRLLNLPPAQRLAMGQAGRRRVQERFSEALVVRAYLDVLEGLHRAKPGS